ncbi:hypothetical protein L21SP2_3496 [Salinispira pacifica]|uniref:Uncharacterized protein n=1 Tax=Salinispira pacifica TaxID=1307761 RepID=V5WLJ7_9SPIO|nr:hypothetical protein L21SP2_3496 [Salinispira pacifica]
MLPGYRSQAADPRMPGRLCRRECSAARNIQLPWMSAAGDDHYTLVGY